ncbi:hypothetical protein CK203_106578 [Vitis vinifera]|uniref:Uncharacterized protein n=1 Tax=Vitis vinifera TaxID=29760 RepID=A0A438CG63_VITVI|nr:hypothetical protein CK203_106578 [Vitis vinifera]
MSNTQSQGLPTSTQCKRKESFLLNLIKIPRLSHKVEAQEGESSKVREVKEVITLRSGKEVDQPTSKPKHDEESVAKKKEIVIKERYDEKHMPPLFPSFAWQKGNNNASEIFEVLRQVKVNIPLLDMIKQVLAYAKFLKDLCTVNKGLNVNKKAFLIEQEWSHATHVWQHEIRAQHLPFVQEAYPSGRRRRSKEVCMIDTLVEEHCDKRMQEDLIESLGNLDEVLPKPQICLLPCLLGGGEKKFYPYSMRKRHKELLSRSPQSLS